MVFQTYLFLCPVDKVLNFDDQGPFTYYVTLGGVGTNCHTTFFCFKRHFLSLLFISQLKVHIIPSVIDENKISHGGECLKSAQKSHVLLFEIKNPPENCFAVGPR